MKESIITDAVSDYEDDTIELEFKNDKDVVEIIFDGKEICRLDYHGNLKPVIKRMLEMWGDEDNE